MPRRGRAWPTVLTCTRPVSTMRGAEMRLSAQVWVLGGRNLRLALDSRCHGVTAVLPARLSRPYALLHHARQPYGARGKADKATPSSPARRRPFVPAGTRFLSHLASARTASRLSLLSRARPRAPRRPCPRVLRASAAHAYSRPRRAARQGQHRVELRGCSQAAVSASGAADDR